MKRFVASAAVVFLSAVVTTLSISACREGSQDAPSITLAPTSTSTTLPFAPVAANVANTPTPAPSPPAEPDPTATTPPSQPAPSRDLSLTQQAGQLQVTLLVSPGHAGYNEISLYFFDPAGVWIGVQTVEIRMTFLDVSAGTAVEAVSPLHPGHAFIAGDYLRHGGRWRIEAVFKGPSLDHEQATFQLAVP